MSPQSEDNIELSKYYKYNNDSLHLLPVDYRHNAFTQYHIYSLSVNIYLATNNHHNYPQPILCLAL